MMQADSDINLGWIKGVQANRYYHWRQLRDTNGSALIEARTPPAVTFYARTGRWTLARRRPVRGLDRHPPGRQRRVRPADQNQHDYTQFANAVRATGR